MEGSYFWYCNRYDSDVYENKFKLSNDLVDFSLLGKNIELIGFTVFIL